MRSKWVAQVSGNTRMAIYPSIADAANKILGQASHICECCRNKRKTHKGYEWRYLEWKNHGRSQK